METIGWMLGLAWGLCGAVAAGMHGNLGLWRITIWMGPLACFVFPPREY